MSIDVAALPKVVLHDHLDGGLRVSTVIELADAYGYTDLPTTDPEELAAWFDQGDSGSLEQYLAAFTHTISLMQYPEAIERVAFEAIEDHAAEGVVYAEVRCAPSLFTEQGLRTEEALEAILAGVSRGERETGTISRFIVDALRQNSDSEAVARAALVFRDQGVVAFDLAGPERGYPCDDHLAACRIIREANLGLTLHAGEGDGPDSIWRALQRCGAHRIGHGVRIIDDCSVADGEIVELGPLATYVRDHRVPLEVCPTSNLQTIGWAPEEHPIGMLHRAGFTVTLATDNRLMSRTSMTNEFQLLVDHQGFTEADLHTVTARTVSAAFCDWETKQRVAEAVAAGYRLSVD